MEAQAGRKRRISPWIFWGAMLGFALGGFFDGILLHQILQWHHVLSLVAGMDDVRLQVLWDGYFHALMYVIAIISLLGLWTAHRRGEPVAPRKFAAALSIGFGLWHIVDALLSHWVLGIHRIKIDSGNPLLWDLLWLAVFGIFPLLIGLWIGRDSDPPLQRSTAVMLALTAFVSGAGVWAMQPPPCQQFTTVVFRLDASPEDVISAVAATDSRLIWADKALGVVVVQVDPAAAWTFYKMGALFVSGSGSPAGCFAWSRV
jgi:uncharacterized membrane protein